MSQVKEVKTWCLSLRAHALETEQDETTYKVKGGKLRLSDHLWFGEGRNKGVNGWSPIPRNVAQRWTWGSVERRGPSSIEEEVSWAMEWTHGSEKLARLTRVPSNLPPLREGKVTLSFHFKLWSPSVPFRDLHTPSTSLVSSFFRVWISWDLNRHAYPLGLHQTKLNFFFPNPNTGIRKL